MNGVPALRIQYPNRGNVLARGVAIEGQEFRNALTQMQLQDYPEEKARRRKREDVEYESKVLEIGTAYLKRVGDIKDYSPYRQYMFQKYDINPQLLPEPEIFGTDEDAFDKWRDQVTLSARERILMNKAELGEKITISKILPDGRVSEIPVYAEEYMKNKDKYPGYKIGKITGTRTPKEEEDKLIPVTAGTRLADPKTGKVKLEAEHKPDADKTGVNYLLKDRNMVTSFDGGRTYRDKTGKDVKMPYDAVRVSATVTGSELDMIEAQKQAGKVEAKQGQPIGDREVGEGGTGPYAMLQSAIDRVMGGLGADKLFGKEGFFPETQENRQVLRTIKQLGKAALMNSSRGAIWEQQRIDELFPDPDKLFTNPRTEAKKFGTLRKTLLQEKAFNNEAIVSSVTPKEVSELRKANVDINRLLSLIGTGEDQSAGGGLSAEDEALINKYLIQGK